MNERLRRAAEMMRFDNRWSLTFGALLGNARLRTYRLNGIEMIADTSGADTGSIQACMGGDMYRKFLAMMDDLAGPLTVADFGANAGGFPGLLGALGFDVRHLMCVEMHPRTYERLRFNVLHNFPTAAVVNAALCGDEREIALSLGVGSTSDNIYIGTHGSADKTYTIRGRTFDDLCSALPGTIDICKMDIEGAEVEILSPNSQFASALGRCRYLLIEMHPVEHYAQMCSVLALRGFKYVADEGHVKCGVHLFHNSSARP